MELESLTKWKIVTRESPSSGLKLMNAYLCAFFMKKIINSAYETTAIIPTTYYHLLLLHEGSFQIKGWKRTYRNGMGHQ